MRASTYKPLLYTTTIRNPLRYKDFMFVFKKFDGQILTNNLSTQICGEIIRYGLFRSMKKSASIKSKWNSTDNGELAEISLTNKEVQYMLDNNPQDHKEAGFDRGWPSRFDTFFKLMKTLGFVYYNIGEPIEFSETGNYLAEIVDIKEKDGLLSEEIKHPEYEQYAFLQALAKQQRSNPFIRELNDNNPLTLLIRVIKRLNADPEYNNAGISYKEIPLLIFWKDNNDESLYLRIKQLRKEYGYNPSDDVIIDICTEEILGGFKKFKPKSIISEYPDEFIRKMRLTGLITLRGAGRFIDINHNEDAKVDYVLNQYSNYRKYDTGKAYFNYMAQIDSQLFEIAAIVIDTKKGEELLGDWLTIYDWNSIKSELNILARKSTTKDNVLRFIPAPARLEFLTSLAIKSKLPDVRVIPNYPCDDEGLPTSTAGGTGDQGDIDCIENLNGILVEVTMSEGRVQTMMEVWPISRHLETFKRKYTPNSQCIFIAPSIFKDSERQIKYIKDSENLQIRPYKIDEFINYLENSNRLYQV